MDAALPETITNELPKGKRRWFQFSLRLLLVMTLLCGCVFAWIAAERQKNANGQANVDTIQNLGGRITYAQNSSIRPHWLQMILGDDSFRHAISVSLDNTQVTDAGMGQLKGLTQLQRLFLDKTQVTDKGLEKLQGLMQLQLLKLDKMQVTDAGVENFKKVNPNCEVKR